MSEYTDLEKRIAILETKSRNIGEDVATLQRDFDDLELWLIETFAKAPGTIMSPAIDYRAIYSDAETVASRLTLGQLPIVKIYIPDIDEAPISALVGYAVRKLPNISPTLLQNSLIFDVADRHLGDYGGITIYSTQSTVTKEIINSFITKYTHTVTYPDYNNISRSYEFLIVTEAGWYEASEPGLIYENGNELRETLYLEKGMYYLDSRMCVGTLMLPDISEDFNYQEEYLVFDRICFNPAITIPASGTSKNELKDYINETILGGKW